MSTTINNQITLPFYEAVLKRKITQICDNVGYGAISQDSLNLLTDLYERTIKQLGTHCKDYANRNRRSEVALVDLVQAYDYIGISIPELKVYINEVKLPFPVDIEQEEPEQTNRVQRNLIEEEKESQQSLEVANDTENSDEISASENGPELLRNRFQELINKFDDCPPISAVKYEIPKPVPVVSPPKPKLKVKVKVKPLAKKNKSHKEKQQPTLKIPTLSLMTSKESSPAHEPIPSPKPAPIKVRIPSPLATVRDPTPTPPVQPQHVSPIPQPSTSSSPPPLTPGAQDAELCPTCNLPDDGSLMIQCDNNSCARWFHGNCVGIVRELEENVTWFCNDCKKAKEIVPHKQRSSKKKIEFKVKSSKKSKLKDSIKSDTPPAPTPTPPAKVITPPIIVVPPPAPLTSGIPDIDLCPTCNLPDDGSMMIQCDDPTCARWFHGNCVGLEREPADDESWFCKGCIEKQQSAFSSRRRPK